MRVFLGLRLVSYELLRRFQPASKFVGIDKYDDIVTLAEQCFMCSNTYVKKPAGTFINIYLKFYLEEDFWGAGLQFLKRVPNSHVKLSKRTSSLLGPS